MLNTKYYLVQNKDNGHIEARGNISHLGNCWLVDSVIWAKNADEEIETLNSFNPKTDVVIDERFKNFVSKSNFNSANSKIKLSSYALNKLVYEAEINSDSEFAVFSEIYYEGTDHDWKSFIDGKPVDHIRVNYILRGMEIPSGKHVVEFRFEPISYFLGEKISLVFSIIVLVSVALILGIEIWKGLKLKQINSIES